jgi:hypothetical protein
MAGAPHLSYLLAKPDAVHDQGEGRRQCRCIYRISQAPRHRRQTLFEATPISSAIAREAAINPGQLYGWRRQLRGQRQIGFSPVQVTDAPAQLTRAGAIEIEFTTEARLRITGAVDRATLTATIAALDGRRQR